MKANKPNPIATTTLNALSWIFVMIVFPIDNPGVEFQPDSKMELSQFGLSAQSRPVSAIMTCFFPAKALVRFGS